MYEVLLVIYLWMKDGSYIKDTYTLNSTIEECMREVLPEKRAKLVLANQDKGISSVSGMCIRVED